MQSHKCSWISFTYLRQNNIKRKQKKCANKIRDNDALLLYILCFLFVIEKCSWNVFLHCTTFPVCNIIVNTNSFFQRNSSVWQYYTKEGVCSWMKRLGSSNIPNICWNRVDVRFEQDLVHSSNAINFIEYFVTWKVIFYKWRTSDHYFIDRSDIMMHYLIIPTLESCDQSTLWSRAPAR